MKILIVEDNEILSNNISTYLNLKQIETKKLFLWSQANYELTLNNYDLLILDLWLPDIDWNEVCRQIRNSWKNIPILMLTARNTINDKKTWFNAGADDYLTKPFDYEELLMRINALVRRNYTIKTDVIILDNNEKIILNITNKSLEKNSQLVHLSNLEIDLLIYLAHNKWKIISKEELLEKVWGEYDNFKMSRTVDVYIWYLRKKVWKNLIETIRWQWYIIN